MKHIRLGFVDFWKEFEVEHFEFLPVLQKYFDIEITNENPDFIFCSCFGYDFLKYSCPRILYLGEALSPDFNLYDYAVGFDRIKYDDRYLRYPFSIMNQGLVNRAVAKEHMEDSYFLNRNKFCNFVVSSGGGMNDIREWYFDKLCEYKMVDSGGRFRNNLPDGKPVFDKNKFQEGYRFSLAFENSQFPGYVTEKILEAWAAGTIPIYWGDPYITQDFNSEAFIECKGKEDLPRVISKIKELEEDPEKYLAMAKKPILNPDGEIMKMMQTNYLDEFLKRIFDQEPQKALRRNSVYTTWGRNYEAKKVEANEIKENKLYRVIEKYNKKRK